MIDLAEIKSRINPAYADRRGTESHERKQLCDEIDRLRAALLHEKDVAEAYKAEAEALLAKVDPEWATTDSSWVVMYLKHNSVFDHERVAAMLDFAKSAAIDSMKGQ